jgi:hypothetical protein
VGEIEAFVAGPPLSPYRASAADRALRFALVPAAVLATVLTLERVKLRGMILHWTRPARLMLRGFVSRAIYAARFVRRLPRTVLRLMKVAGRRLIVGPARWGLNRGKTTLHNFLVWRKGEPEQMP